MLFALHICHSFRVALLGLPRWPGTSPAEKGTLAASRCLRSTFSLLRCPEPGRAGRVRGWLHSADGPAMPRVRLALAYRVLFQRGVGLSFVRRLFPSLLILKRGGGRGGLVALCGQDLG